MKYISSLNENGVRIYDTDTCITEYVRTENIRDYDFTNIDGAEIIENRVHLKVSKKHKLNEMKLKLSGNTKFDSDNLAVKTKLRFDTLSATIFVNGRISLSVNNCDCYDTSLTIEEYEHYIKASETDEIRDELLSLVRYLYYL